MNLEFLLAWAHARLEAARVIPPDALLLITATCVVLLLVSFVGWVKASNRLHVVGHAKIALEGEIATARRALDTERRWRVVAEKTAADATKPGVAPDPLPPHALQALLERELSNPDPAGATAAGPPEEAEPIGVIDEPAPAPAAPEQPPAPVAEVRPEPAALALIETLPAPARAGRRRNEARARSEKADPRQDQGVAPHRQGRRPHQPDDF